MLCTIRKKMNWSIAIYFILAIILFYIQNWIGSKSYSRGYIKFSLLDEKDEALSLNFMIKAVGPTVYLIITSALIQYSNIPLNLDKVIWIVYFYLLLRVSVIYLYGRSRIVNWPRILIHYLAILVFATIIQKKFISSIDVLLPDFSEIKNEIWLLIILFLYQVGNSQMGLPEPSSDRERGLAYLPELIPRKRKYIQRMYKKLQDKYGALINPISQGDIQFEIVVYSILIFENFNRPPFIRLIERIWTRISGNETSMGIMQVKTNHVISDEESIEIGALSLKKEYDELRKEDRYGMFGNVIKYHSPDRKYIRQVLFISKAIIDHSFSKEERKEKFKDIYSQISNEFGLYFYY
ncbi:hypothetical protein AWW67_05085 [Roseivirga seohaensis]|uniref:Uncharacterized protein n=2 Tax=Roseivirga seohaensis TaxID=1914963 RepID=A0A150Y0N4_9BACT|nr:hypothetical protein AWW67_05085 [Roseivirga seohaensis]